MSDDIINPQPVVLIGGGRGGVAFIDLLRDEKLFELVGVVDQNSEAPAIAMARDMGIPVYDDVATALNASKPCSAFNLTYDESLSDLAAEILGPCSIIGGHEAKLIWRMVSQLKAVRDELGRNQVMMQSIIDHAMEGIILIDTKGVIRSFNPAAEDIFGYAQEEVIGQNVSLLMPEPDSSSHDSYLDRYLSSHQNHVVGIRREVTAKRKNGRTFPLSLSVNAMEAGDEHYFVGIVSDISERKNNEAITQRLAHFDNVTELPNRTLYFERLERGVAQARRYGQKLAVMFLDLDGFKKVNDTLGHAIGDALLKTVAKRLSRTLREVDTVARFGGDEFIFVLNDVKTRENAATIADKVLEAIIEPILLDGHRCQVGGSIGISIYPDDSAGVDTLIHQADSAMYAVKKAGKNHHRFYDPGMQMQHQEES